MRISNTLFMIMLLAFTVVAARAETLTVSDSSTQFFLPGFGTTDAMKYNGKNANGNDAWGTPNITQANISFSGNKLTTISIDFKFPELWGWSSIKPGDLFLDLNSDNVWDVVLDSPWVNKGPSVGVTNQSWNAYNVQFAATGAASLTNYEYTRLSSNTASANAILAAFSGKSYTVTQDYNGEGIPRYDHPVAARQALLTSGNKFQNSVDFSGWKNVVSSTNDTMEISWNLSALDLHSNQLTFAFAVNCANDNIYGDPGPTPTPEPASMLLMGVGAVGAAWMRRRKMKNAN